MQQSSNFETFTNSELFLDANEAKKLLKTHSKIVNDSLRIHIYPAHLTIKLEIDLNFLDLSDESMRTLGFSLEDPVVISIIPDEKKFDNLKKGQLSWGDILDLLTFECVQGSFKECYGTRDFLSTFARRYVTKLKRQISKGEWKPSLLLTLKEKKKDKRRRKESSSSSSSGSSSDSDNNKGFRKRKSYKPGFADKNKRKSEPSSESIRKLKELGFTEENSRKALKESKNDFEKAVEVLLKGAGKVEEHIKNDELQVVANLEGLPKTESFVLNFLLYLRDKVQNCTNYCVVCFKRHLADSIRLRPCEGQICQYTFEERFEGDVYPELQKYKDTVALDVSSAAMALFSQRSADVFEPFPTFFLKNEDERMRAGYLDEVREAKGRGGGNAYGKIQKDNENKNIEKLQKIFRRMPKVKKLVKKCKDEKEIKEKLLKSAKGNEKDSFLMHKLLRYIVATNRLNIIKLPEEDILEEFPEEFDLYMVANQSPEKESYFRNQKKKHGSVFLFHGSSLENWYSILRNGLRNLSNTGMMTAGAAMGPGIYTASAFATSYGYSARHGAAGEQWKHATLNNYFIMGIVEVIKKNNYAKNGWSIAVVTEEEDIMLRYLVLFPRTVNYQQLQPRGRPSKNPNKKKKKYAANPAMAGGLMFGGMMGTGILGDSTQIDFDDHYYGYMEKIEKEYQKVKIRRIEKSLEQYRKRAAEEEKSGPSILKKAAQSVSNISTPAQLDEEFKKIKERMRGKVNDNPSNRLLKEIELLNTNKFFQDINIELDGGGNWNTWTLTISPLNTQIPKSLKEDFVRAKKNVEIIVETTFDEDYPYTPPFIQLKKHKFANTGAEITQDGLLFLNQLKPDQWKPTLKLVTIMKDITDKICKEGSKLSVSS